LAVGALVGEKAMPVKADLKVVSEVQEMNIHDSHILEKSRASTGCLYHLSKYPRWAYVQHHHHVPTATQPESHWNLQEPSRFLHLVKYIGCK